LIGLAKDNYLAYELAIQHIHSMDVDRVNQAVTLAINPQSGGHYDQTYRTMGADDGKLHWVRFYGRAYFLENGALERFADVAHEVTQQKLTEKRELTARHHAQHQQQILETISANTSDLIYVFDLDYRFTYAN
jgi:PAS domain-containing protein